MQGLIVPIGRNTPSGRGLPVPSARRSGVCWALASIKVAVRRLCDRFRDRPVERQGMSHSLLGSRARPHSSSARMRGMKTVREACLDRTIKIISAMFVWAWTSQAQSQNLDCNNGCGTYAEYALAQRLHLPESIQNLPHDKIETWFSHHPQYSGSLKALADECESSCAKCGDWTCR
jgi:hypothetical protein